MELPIAHCPQVRPFASHSVTKATQNLLVILLGDDCAVWCVLVMNHATGVEEDAIPLKDLMENCSFNSHCSDGTDTGEGVQEPATSIIGISVALGTVAVCTTIFNSLVIAAIVVNRKLHQPANYLICSLAVTDFLVAILVMPLGIVHTVSGAWLLGDAACQVWLSVDVACCTCSILHLCAIALDRYWAITRAVQYARKRTPCRAAIMIAAVWSISALISLPLTLGMTDGGEQCVIRHSHVLYTVFSTCGAFYIPLALILVLYCRIYRAARLHFRNRGSYMSSRHSSVISNGAGREAPNPAGPTGTIEPKTPTATEKGTPNSSAEATPGKSKTGKVGSKRPRISSTRERKAAKTLGLILGAFILCWLPFFIKELVVNICETCTPPPAVSAFLTWLGYVNSLINPLIYTSFNDDFRSAFKKLWRCRQ
uniref:5-hydroxytryptamine receptor 1F-like n=1 Tax=Myxine glutinosa TaxID=7769 RepID=UPI00358F7F92